jgi:UDPglucose 6-dehydrogenase/GDP-mannose 6-dehydrogenase
MKISIIGAGYVGLVTGVCLSNKGNDVVCVDYDQDKIKSINQGISPIYEEGLDKLLKNCIGKSFEVTSSIEYAIECSDVTFIAVGTPFHEGKINLDQIISASEAVGACLKKKDTFHTVIIKSTVVPGTTNNLVKNILEKTSKKKCNKEFGLGMNPEFLREGKAISDFMNPDRLVFGGSDKKVHSILKEIYAEFINEDIIFTTNNSAEMIKYTSNSLLATLISFSNEIGNLCETLDDVDSEDIFKAVHLDKRLSPIIEKKRITPEINTYLKSGCGFGGSCFPKDVNALISFGKSNGQSMSLLNSVIEVNKKQPNKIVDKIKSNFSSLENLKIGILGLSFKPETDDIRESPAITIIKKLLKYNSYISAYDPIAQANTKKLFNKNEIKFCKSIYEAIYNVEVIVLLTAWEEFKDLDIILKENKLNPLVIDGRRFLNKKKFNKFEAIGM